MKVNIILNKNLDSIPCAYRFFCFTGKFRTGKRKEFQTLVSEKGGIVKDHINRVVNFLVIGNEIYDELNEPVELEKLNNKIVNAYNLILDGIDIKIISENQFLFLLNNYKSKTYTEYLKIQSFKDPNKEYNINLNELTCECAHFKADRLNYSQNDPRRLCKHLVKALFDLDYVPISLTEFKEKVAIAYLYMGGISGWGQA